jgi:hypothetical protein
MNSRQFPPLKECPLCQHGTQLVESHIIPKFFGRELKKRSNSQTLVNVLNPQKNPRPQDITKTFLLCRGCELLISKVETEFRNKIMPANKSLLCPIAYGDWMLKFAVSISWRVLTYLKYAPSHSEQDVTSKKLLTSLPTLLPESHSEAEKALEAWRLFLLGQVEDVGEYDQHLVVLSGKNFPHENCNALAFTLFQQDGIIATHTLLGQFIILGFIKHSKIWEWKNTKLERASGEIGKPFAIPLSYGEWLADMFAEFERISVEDWKARKEQ